MSISYFNTFLFPPIAAIRYGRRALGMTGKEEGDFEGSRPGPLNNILEKVFALERHFVWRASMPFGVSLLAILRQG